MDLRIYYSAILTVLVILDALCAVVSFRSSKPIGKPMGLLDLSFIPPILGNVMIIGTSDRSVAMAGYYLYFLGMNAVMASLVNFTNTYCRGIGDGSRKPTAVYYVIAADTVQMLANLCFGHAFDVESITLQGLPYYRLVPHFGQTIHRVVDYGVFLCVCLIFGLSIVKTVRIYREKYTVILIAMLSIAVSQTYFIFSRKPIDRSMIGYGFIGILMMYLSIYYRPLRLLDRMLSDIVSDMPEAMYLYDAGNRCIWANEPGFRFAGVTEKNVNKATEKLAEIFGKKDFTEDEWNETRVIGEGEEARYYYIEKQNVRYKKKRIAGSFLSIRDETEEHRRMEREYYNTTHDGLTGLYTKQYLFESIRKRLAEDKETRYLVIYVDVKNFKIVNDIFGTAFGDMAIRQIADRIRRDVTDRSIFGRLAGDTFGIFMPVHHFSSEVLEEKLGNFVVADGTVEHRLQIHAGIYEITDPSMEVSVMFDRAHLSLSAIKENYKSHVSYYDLAIRERVLEEQNLCAEIQTAMERMQIRPYLQPIVDAKGEVVGAEALVRWIHPERGFMPPVKFVPLFEKNGLIVEIDRHMWRCACQKLAEWKGVHDDVFLSVNISPKDFYYIDVVSEIRSLVEEYAIEPRRLRLEITETMMMNGSEERLKIVEDLRQAGFVVEMDDFGSGYSSLNLLKDMPVDVLKIDMKFLSDRDEHGRSDTILKHIIMMAEELQMTSLTEGVETEKQYTDLVKMGCRLFQGYHFAKPMPVEDFEKYAFENRKE